MHIRKLLLFIFFILCSFDVYALKDISPENFIAENSSSERKNIVDFIVHQFDNKLEDGVTQAQLDNIWNDLNLRKNHSMVRFQVVNQKLYADTFDLYNDCYVYYIQKLVNKYKIRDIDFIIYERDGINSDKVLGIPAFMPAKNLDSIHEKEILLFPDPYMVVDYWQKLIERIEEANTKYPWNKKINKLFFRGFLTGGSDDIDSPNVSPRLTLSILSKLYPDLIDSKLTGFHRIVEYSNNKHSIADFLFGPGTPINEQEGTLYKANHVTEEDHLKYKYIMSIDGNTAAWRRVPWIMLSNSVLVKQESNKIQWFYSAMKPYVHYVPVNERITDIFLQLEWMKSHDAKLQQISQNAQNFVKNNLMPEHVDAHSVIILNEYHKLHKGAEIIPTLPPVEETIAKIEVLKPKMGRKKRLKKFFNDLKDEFL